MFRKVHLGFLNYFCSVKCGLFILLLSVCLRASAVYVEFTPELTHAQKALTTLRLKQASKLIAAEIAKHPDNVAGQYLLHYSAFYKLIINLDPAQTESFFRLNESTLQLINKLPESSPYKKYLGGSLLLQSAIVKGAFENFLGAAWDFRTAYQKVKENEQKFPLFLGHKKEMGALIALAGTFPQQYNWILEIAGLEPNFEKGMQILHHYIQNFSQEPIIEQQQAVIIYTLIQLNFGSDKKKAWTFCKDYTKDYTHSLMHSYVRAFVAGKCGENDVALLVLKARPTDESFEQVNYLNFMMGEFLLHQLDYSAAIWYKKHIAYEGHKVSQKESYQKLSWISWLYGDTIRYITYHHLMEKNAKSKGSEADLIDADLANGIYPSPELLKARLLFDGGYYAKALGQLARNNPHPKSKYQKVEWNYRQARIHQEENRMGEAIEGYKKVIEMGVNINTYYLPNACLNLGLIYEQLKYPSLAIGYYERVANYKDYDYESSIRQKAKAGLYRLK